MRPKASWAIDSDTMRARGIIVKWSLREIIALFAIDSDTMRARGIILSKIQLVGQKDQEKNFTWLKLDLNPFLSPKSLPFSVLVGYNI